MSTKSNSNRRQQAAKEASEVTTEEAVVEETAADEDVTSQVPEQPELATEVQPEAQPEAKSEVQDAQAARSRDEEAYLVASLVGSARSLFGVNPEVVVGALAHAEIEDKATVSQVNQAINAYLQLPV
jgi:hypothetical protein